jgi:hypothetical protein
MQRIQGRFSANNFLNFWGGNLRDVVLRLTTLKGAGLCVISTFQLTKRWGFAMHLLSLGS